MGDVTKISWCDRTHNEWIGCTKVSQGCKFCYAENDTPARVLRAHGKETWGPNGVRHLTSAANRRKPYTWNKQQWEECPRCQWRGPVSATHDDCPECSEVHLRPTRQRVFCSSLSDVFEDNAQLDGYRRDLLKTVEDCRNLDWLLLTKRPENVMRLIAHATGRQGDAWLDDCRHVWLGTTVENQDAADERIPVLLDIPAKVRFLSCEPLLGQVKLFNVSAWNDAARWWGKRLDIHWAIAGGESGPGARPMHPDWARSLRDQCLDAGVPFHFKQWGEWLVSSHLMAGEHPDSGVYAWPWKGEGDSTMMVRVGKKAAGRVLDGRVHAEFPRV